MSDTHVAPDSGAGEALPVSVITPAADTPADLSPHQAAKALAQARWSKREPAAPEVAAPENPIDAAPVEEQPSGETTETPDPVETPTIEPPRSLTKEQKEAFKLLPPEVQRNYADLERTREVEFRRGQNEAAELRKAAEAERTQAEKARQDYEAKLPQLMQSLMDAQAGAFSDIRTVDDVSRLAQEDPFRYVQWQAHQTKVQAVAHEMRQTEHRQHEEAQRRALDFRKSEHEKLVEKHPEFTDSAKLQAAQTAAVDFLTSDKGFTRDELAEMASGRKHLSVDDHRFQSLIVDAMKYRDAQKARTVVQAKPVPPVQKPGVAAPKGAADAEVFKNLSAKLERSGSLKDAVALRTAQARRA